MTPVEEIERIVRRYLQTGFAVVVLLVAPGADVDGLLPDADRPGVVVGAPEDPAPGEVPDLEPVGEPPREPTPDDLGPGAAGAPDPAPEEAGDTAADRLGWGAPDRTDEFEDPALAGWTPYTGTGHGGHGARSPDALTVADGVLTITGDAAGSTGGMCWGDGQRYGRWEARVRAPAADPSYDAVLLLWPDADDFPAGGEIDFAEMQDPDRQVVEAHLHHGPADELVSGRVQVDATQWRNWAVEWSPEAIVAYVDGEQWFRTTDVATFPPGPMHLCVQLDWFPPTPELQSPDPESPGSAPTESTMEVEWVRQWSAAG